QTIVHHPLGSHSCKSTVFFDHFRFMRHLEVKNIALSQEFERSSCQERKKTALLQDWLIYNG
ncbi:hypothetical protein ABEV74_15825, partial [Paenibacillus cisolokensis]|uniref:hypothetical protein n=1 Tax=Paenibacillus cisolokensis TaxID=1658519 RepID=UPI003D2CBE66